MGHRQTESQPAEEAVRGRRVPGKSRSARHAAVVLDGAMPILRVRKLRKCASSFAWAHAARQDPLGKWKAVRDPASSHDLSSWEEDVAEPTFENKCITCKNYAFGGA